MIVWVASYPRSGNMLTLMTLMHSFGVRRIGSVWGKDLVERLASYTPEREDLVNEVPRELRDFADPEVRAKLNAAPEVTYLRTHRLIDADDPFPALHIVRDGRDAVVSQTHFVEARETPRFAGMGFEQRMTQLIDPGIRAQGNWGESFERWSARAAPTTRIHYERLIADPVGVVAEACDRLGLSLPDASGSPPEFADLRSRNPTFARRGVARSWRDEMPAEIEALFWDRCGEAMTAAGYER